jgi:hypothetical protein
MLQKAEQKKSFGRQLSNITKLRSVPNNRISTNFIPISERNLPLKTFYTVTVGFALE